MILTFLLSNGRVRRSTSSSEYSTKPQPSTSVCWAWFNKVNVAVMNRYVLYNGGYYYNRYYHRYGYLD